MFRTLGVGAVALLLAACGALKPHQTALENPQGSAPPPAGTAYRIDASRSELRILVYRAGPLARLGHNHVMVNRAIGGSVNLADEPEASGFSLSVPVAAFTVDDAQARREEGADFAAEVPDDARSGTLRNMLSTAVLDADEFPAITVAGVTTARAPGVARAAGAAEPGTPQPGAPQPGAPNPQPEALIARVAITVAGHQSAIDVPFTLQIESGRLSAGGSVELRQTALGLIPYSLMLGALQVEDRMTLKFKIVAVPG